MLHLTGEEKIEQPPDVLWLSLARPEFLCQCFPGVDRVVRSDDRSAAIVVRPGFSFVRGTLDVSFEFTETDAPRSARALIHVKGIGSSAELEMQFHTTLSDGGTLVAWTANTLQVGGLLKAVSQGLMQAAAQKVASDTWSEVRKRIAAQRGIEDYRQSLAGQNHGSSPTVLP
jgi:carbon monoxide dehydrogenase subunit G